MKKYLFVCADLESAYESIALAKCFEYEELEEMLEAIDKEDLPTLHEVFGTKAMAVPISKLPKFISELAALLRQGLSATSRLILATFISDAAHALDRSDPLCIWSAEDTTQAETA